MGGLDWGGTLPRAKDTARCVHQSGLPSQLLTETNLHAQSHSTIRSALAGYARRIFHSRPASDLRLCHKEAEFDRAGIARRA